MHQFHPQLPKRRYNKKLVTSCVLSRLDYCNSLFMGTPNSVIQPKQKVRMPLHVLYSEHHAINTAHPSHSNFIGFQFLNYCSCTALSALHQTHEYSNSDTSTAKFIAFALSPISVLISGTASPRCQTL